MDVWAWCYLERAKISAFARYWDREHIKDPKLFSGSLTASEWDEQYESWHFTNEVTKE